MYRNSLNKKSWQILSREREIKTSHKATLSPRPQKKLGVDVVDQEEKLIKCPGCALLLPERDFQAQNNHMVSTHPEIIVERLREANMNYEADEFEEKINGTS